MATVTRTHHALGRRHGHRTLEQRFAFSGDGATASVIGTALMTAPLVGSESIFGGRPGREGATTETSRILRGFSPAPGFRFDVALAHLRDGVFLVSFAQPDRRVPYLEGDFVWRVTDEEGVAVFDEQINTEAAMQEAERSLGGPRPSLRRWLFFRAGHQKVMANAMANLGRLVGR